MELMCHSDRKLTVKICTDSNLLPLGEVVRNLPDEGPMTNISGAGEGIAEGLQEKPPPGCVFQVGEIPSWV